MGFTSIRVFNFRNLKNGRIILDAPEIFLIGENGQGKTNYIEALYLLCFGSSFRTKRDKIMINNSKDIAMVQGTVCTEQDGNMEITIKIARSGKKEIKINSKLIKDRKEIIKNIPCIVFSHSDMEFVIGSPNKRRWFFNQTLSLFNTMFIDLLRNYKKCLKQRNAILREKRLDLLDVYNKKLVKYGMEIQNRRKNTVKLFNQVFTEVYKKVSGINKDLKIIYKPSWLNNTTEEEVIGILEKNYSIDMNLGITTTGPHRDIFLYYLEGKNFAKFASTGQVRLISVILRIAQAQFFFKLTKKRPVLLVDDVLLEIDLKRRQSFIKNLPEYEQAFFTFLPDEAFLKYKMKNTILYTLRNGDTREWKKQEIF